MGSFLVIKHQPPVQNHLKFFESIVNLLSEFNFVKFILDRFMESFSDAISL